MQTSSRLKPVPLVDRGHPVGLAVGLTMETRAFGRAGCGTHTGTGSVFGGAPYEIHCGTGFSREGVRCIAAKSKVHMRASSRLKPVPLVDRGHPVELLWG
jgi:hypothetical protein